MTSGEDLARLALTGTADGPTPEEALRLLAELRTTPEEGRAIYALLARHATNPLPDSLLLAVASALEDRGEPDAAARSLAGATSTAALLRRADLAHRAGDAATAVAEVERVLLRDIDWPGARERHGRWTAALDGPPRTRALDLGTTLAVPTPDAPFHLLREVARGGSGAVYEAEDRILGRRVALKVYHRPEADRDQLLHEARVAVTLAGEGVVRVFDVDPQRGWLVMEWARAGALRARLGRYVFDTIAIGVWASRLARALGRVHAAGWVHNDIKPANVLLRTPTSLVLGDFGTARGAGEAAPPGSLGYVSPERLGGRPSDPRDDVYGFGRVLEDVLAALPGGGAPGACAAPWRSLARRCTGQDPSRPRDGRVLSVIVDEAAGRQDGGER
ncbi:MAG TPA: protein kinase [Polyangiaceae bacterium]|nr:protein kinase [Polyangiaceae bacterium]